MPTARTVFSGPRIYGGAGLLDRLPSSLTINSTTVNSFFRYLGKDANGSDWVADKGLGETLALQAGTAPTLQQPAAPNMSSKDKSVLYNAGGYHESLTAGNGEITTEDAVFECVVKYEDDGGTDMFLGNRVSGDGYMLYASADKFIMVVDDASGSATISSGATTDGTWYHLMLFLDRSGSAQFYVDGVASGSATNISARALTWASALPVVIGARAGGTSPYASNVAYCAIWKSAAWLDTHLQAATALERAKLLGFA